MNLAENVALTALPFGGAVLINSHTLALVELNEPEAEVRFWRQRSHDG